MLLKDQDGYENDVHEVGPFYRIAFPRRVFLDTC